MQGETGGQTEARSVGKSGGEERGCVKWGPQDDWTLELASPSPSGARAAGHREPSARPQLKEELCPSLGRCSRGNPGPSARGPKK